MGLLGLTQYYGLGFLPYLQEGGRIEITLGNPTYVGAYMMVNILVGLGLLIQSYYPSGNLEPVSNNTRSARRRNRTGKTENSGTTNNLLYIRMFWIASIFIGLYTLFLSGTRGAFLGLMAGLIVFSLGYIKWGNKDFVLKVVRISIACIVILGVVALIINRNGLVGGVRGGDNVVSRVVSTGINDASFQGRISSLTLGLKGFTQKPLMGWGPENFTVAYDRYLTPEIAAQSTSSFDQAHNKIVEEFIFLCFSENVSKIKIITGKGSRSKNKENPYLSENLSILKYSVPEFIKTQPNLMKMIKDINYNDVEDSSIGSFDIFLKKIKG